MAITNSNIFSESYNLVNTFLKEYITDPRSRYKKQWIHASMPNINDKGFNGYPFIILKFDVSESMKSFDNAIGEKAFSVLISVYSDDASEVDSISDSIFSNFKDMELLTEFPSRELSSSNIQWNLDEHGKKILFRDIGIILRSRI